MNLKYSYEEPIQCKKIFKWTFIIVTIMTIFGGIITLHDLNTLNISIMTLIKYLIIFDIGIYLFLAILYSSFIAVEKISSKNLLKKHLKLKQNGLKIRNKIKIINVNKYRLKNIFKMYVYSIKIEISSGKILRIIIEDTPEAETFCKYIKENPETYFLITYYESKNKYFFDFKTMENI